MTYSYKISCSADQSCLELGRNTTDYIHVQSVFLSRLATTQTVTTITFLNKAASNLIQTPIIVELSENLLIVLTDAFQSYLID